MNSKSEKAVVRCRGGSPFLEGTDGFRTGKSCTEILAAYPDGIRVCSYGCLGGGSCAAVCEKQAISINENGTAEIDPGLCCGCGSCAAACPRHLIFLQPAVNNITVRCENTDPGPEAGKKCKNSCIGCGICEKNCPAGAIRVVDHLARIDGGLCIACGMCAARCPRGAIADANGIFSVR